jgi:hypothetical protein
MRVFAAAAVASILVACSKSNSNPPPPTEATLTAMNLCTELAKVDCDRLDKCGLLKGPLTHDRCLLRQEKLACLPYQAPLLRAVTAGEVAFFENAANGCRDKIAGLDCSVDIRHVIWNEPECKGLVGPLTAEGGKCSLVASCMDGLACTSSDGTCPGTCKKLAQNNDPCTASTPCASGLLCALPVMRCHAAAPRSAPCELSAEGNACVTGSFCDMSNPLSPTCAPARGRGNGCSTPYECASGFRCVDNACSSGQAPDACVTEADCADGFDCWNNRCGTPVGDGAMCSDTIPCRESTFCLVKDMTAIVGTCTTLAGAGEACTNAKPCYLSQCTMGNCAEAAADGAACKADADCLPGRTCTMGICTLVEVPCTATP